MTIDAQDVAALSRIGWFSRQELALQRRLADVGRVVVLQRGQWVYSQGDSGTGLCAVLGGALRLEVALGTERDVLLSLAQAPTILGQTRRRGGGPRLVTVRANVPSRVLMITDDALEAVARDAPEIWRAVNELVYAQLEDATKLAAMLLISDPMTRVAMRLIQYAVGDQATINQTDLAEMTGLSRKTVNGHLATLERLGAIERGYRVITLLDRAVLERVVR